MQKPSKNEYAAYFDTYVRLVPDGEIKAIIEKQMESTAELFAQITEDQSNYRYAEGKWSLKEVLGHIADTERIMSYRLLRIARGDGTPLPGFDENEFVRGADFDASTLAELLDDYNLVRKATLSLLRGISDKALSRRGTVSNKEITANALAYIIAGHELHHIAVVKERYLAE
jgi:uncharacterized damage-inducible protein DinB